MEDIVIVSAARTAVGKFGGSLAKVAATELGSIVIREALARAKLDAAPVELAKPPACALPERYACNAG